MKMYGSTVIVFNDGEHVDVPFEEYLKLPHAYTPFGKLFLQLVEAKDWPKDITVEGEFLDSKETITLHSPLFPNKEGGQVVSFTKTPRTQTMSEVAQTVTKLIEEHIHVINIVMRGMQKQLAYMDLRRRQIQVKSAKDTFKAYTNINPSEFEARDDMNGNVTFCVHSSGRVYLVLTNRLNNAGVPSIYLFEGRHHFDNWETLVQRIGEATLSND